MRSRRTVVEGMVVATVGLQTTAAAAVTLTKEPTGPTLTSDRSMAPAWNGDGLGWLSQDLGDARSTIRPTPRWGSAARTGTRSQRRGVCT
jgi:hypothetical protein